MPGNALVIETLRGLLQMGYPLRAYLLCLLVQAAAVVLWWPKSGNLTSDTPVTLFALLIALTVTLAYHCVRLGAEELTFPAQQSFREWLLSTRLPLPRLLFGYLLAHILQTTYWLLLSTPLLLMAWSVTGSAWHGLALCVLCLALLVSVCRLAAS